MEDTLVDYGVMNLSALPHIGEVVNEKYQIKREIARGGMGVVYEALDIVLNFKVAFKILQFQEATPIAIKRFEREIKACNQLSHPNIVKVYSGGIYKKSPYMIMDYIDGVPITKYIKEHNPAYGTSEKRNYNLCVELIEKIANALEYIHQKKIYHRDIKPSNILVTKNGTPMLIDFGIVKFQQNQSQSLTKTNEIIGTCSYMSPEQVGRKQALLDHRSDIYSLGVVLYELLTEQNAFTGSMLQILNAIVTTYPPFPTAIRNDIPKSLEEIVMTAIKKDKNDRYANAKEFADALNHYLHGTHEAIMTQYNYNKKRNHYLHGTHEAIMTQYNYNKKRFGLQRNKKHIIACSIALLIVGTIFISFYAEQQKEEKKLAEQQKLIEQQQLANQYYTQGKFREAFNLFQELADQGNKEGQFKLGKIYNHGQGVIQDFSKARYWYEKSANQGHAIAQNNLGVMYDSGRGVPKDYAKALYWFEKSAEQGLKEGQYNLGGMYESGRGVPKDYAKALYWYEKSANQGDASAQYNLGVMYDSGKEIKQDYAKALYWYEKSAEQGNAGAQNNLGSMYYNGQGVAQNFAKAFELYKQAAYQGFSQAQYNLSVMYEQGQGVEKNKAKAEYCLKQSQQKK